MESDGKSPYKFELGSEYRIGVTDYIFPSYGIFEGARMTSSGLEYMFRITRFVDLRIRYFSLRDEDITFAHKLEPARSSA